MASVVEKHNSVLRRATARARELEPKLAAVIQPILEQAGVLAAANFERYAQSYTASGVPLEARRSDSEPLVASAPGVTSLSTMVALVPRGSEQQALEHQGEGALPAEELHVTLCYLGEYEGDLDALAMLLRPVAAEHAPMEGKVAGVGAFEGKPDEPRPNLMLPSVPGLIELRVDVTRALDHAGVTYSRDYGYVPHMTSGYTEDRTAMPSLEPMGKPLHFDALWIIRGDVERVELPLTGAAPLTASLAPSLTASGPAAWVPPPASQLLDVDALVAGLRTKTDPVRQAVVETTMKTALADHGIEWDVTNPLTKGVLAHSGEQITNISQTTQLNVNRIVNKSYEEGLSIPDTATAIKAGMKEASTARATLIARTELVGAVNGGSLAATQIVSDATGVAMNKQWLTAPGAPHPRHELYEGLNGQTVPLDAFFQVGADQLGFPGDPGGSPEEVCNCRCTIIYTEGGSVVAEGDAEEALSPDDAAAAAEEAAAGEDTLPSDGGAVDTWVTDGSSINMALRGDLEVAQEMGLPKDYKSLVSEMDSAMSPVKEAVTSWRGTAAWRESMGLRYDATVNDAIGKTFVDPAFTSVTSDLETAKAFSDGEVLMRISIPRGADALDISEANAQKELLLARDTQFTVTGVTREEGYSILHVDVSASDAATTAATPSTPAVVESWLAHTVEEPPFLKLPEFQSFDGVGAFDQLPETDLRVSDLTPTQKSIDWRYAQTEADTLVPIDVVQYDGKYYVWDGHHRVASAINDRDEIITARVLDAGSAPTESIKTQIAQTNNNMEKLRGVKVSDDAYVASLQRERYTTTNKINGLLAKEKRGTITDKDRGRLEALRKRQADIRDLLAEGGGDPKAEKYRVQNQINYMNRLVRSGDATHETLARLEILTERRDKLAELLKSPAVKSVLEETKVASSKTTASQTVVPSVKERAATLNANSAVSLGSHIDASPDGLIRVPAHSFEMGSAPYDMNDSIAFKVNGVVVKVELPDGSTHDKASMAYLQARKALVEKQIGPELADAPVSMREELRMVTVAQGYSPDDAYWARMYPGFTHAAAQGGRGQIWFWKGGDISGSFKHELGHVVGESGGPRFEDDWKQAAMRDSQTNARKFELHSGYSVSGRNFQIGEPAVTSYAANAPAEDWAESIRLWLTDRQTGYMGIAAKDGQPVKVRFADVYPSRDKLIRRWLKVDE